MSEPFPTPRSDRTPPAASAPVGRTGSEDRREPACETGMPTRRAMLAPLLAAGALAGLGAGHRTAEAATNPAGYDDAGYDGAAATGRHRGNDLIVRDARVFDGERVLERVTVLVLDGRIVAVSGSGRVAAGSVDGIVIPRGTPTFEGRGRTLIPGLVDAHVHSDPEFRREAPRFGITTELDMFGDPSVLPAAKGQRWSSRRTAYADLWSAGVGVTVPGGHPRIPDWDYPTVTDDTDLDDFVGARIREGSDYVKIIVEDGDGTLPSLTATQVRAAVVAAHRHGKLAVAHAERVAHLRTAVAAGVDGVVHVAIDERLDDELIARVRGSGIFVAPTVTVVDCGAGAEDVLRDQRTAPFLSELQQYTLTNRPPRPCRPEYRENAIGNTERLHLAGVPVLAGTDAPLPGTANGVSLLTALGYLTEAGLRPAEALTAATATPARMFGLGDRGRIHPGYRADLVLVDGDPTTDIDRVRSIVSVWKNGFPIDRTPKPAP